MTPQQRRATGWAARVVEDPATGFAYATDGDRLYRVYDADGTEVAMGDTGAARRFTPDQLSAIADELMLRDRREFAGGYR